MKTVACLLILFTLSAAACAEEADGFLGEPGCRVAPLVLETNASVLWKGPCKDGYADGPGVLERYQRRVLFVSLADTYEVTMARGRISGDGKLKYKNGDIYTGSFKDGRRDGKGYTAFADGDQYDGQYQNDVPHGTGVMLHGSGTEYEGDWKDGKQDGIGSIKYSLGGGYLGAWKGGKFHGKGVLTYAGSGRKREAEFDNGRVRGVSAPPLAHNRYSLDPAPLGLDFLMPRATTGPFPFDKPYGEMTPEQQAVVKKQYPALEDGDEPPYPLHGLKQIFAWIKQAQQKTLVTGTLRLNVLVGKDGDPVSVKTIGAPSPEIARFAAIVVGKEKFKPAVCHGAPCEMVYPFLMEFIVE